MKKYLILVKHSVPEIVEGLPPCEWKLSDEGHLRAQRLAERLGPFHPEVIVSSCEPKARETAQAIAGRYNLELHSTDGLHEHARSTAPYLPHAEFQAAIAEFFEKPDLLVFGSETADQAYARFYEAVHSVLSDYEGKTIILVTHGTVISLFVSRLTSIPDLSLWKNLGLPSYLVLDMQTRTLIAQHYIV